MTLSREKSYYLKLLFTIILFLCCGLLSTYLYFTLQGKGGVYFPGLLYTSTTLIVFLLTKKTVQTKNILIYYILMFLTYFIIYWLTYQSVRYLWISGPITAGLGALLTFIITNKFITKIKYNKFALFLVGALAFVLTFILYFAIRPPIDITPFEYIFNLEPEPSIPFIELFLFWQPLVGVKLFLTLYKSGQDPNISGSFEPTSDEDLTIP